VKRIEGAGTSAEKEMKTARLIHVKIISLERPMYNLLETATADVKGGNLKTLFLHNSAALQLSDARYVLGARVAGNCKSKAGMAAGGNFSHLLDCFRHVDTPIPAIEETAPLICQIFSTSSVESRPSAARKQPFNPIQSLSLHEVPQMATVKGSGAFRPNIKKFVSLKASFGTLFLVGHLCAVHH
jgi:hypothetical protein